ncbi:MAG: methionine synthase [Bacteroidaceae bacterium]|nr:methionine synthase [Bacteroidaceae bacterium]
MSIREELCKGRILVLDGAMGTMIQTYGLKEEDFRGHRFRMGSTLMMGCNDVLSITRPDVIRDIHRRYLEAGADIITANTFSANSISMADYGLQDYVRELNRESVRLAREEAEKAATEDKPRFVIATVSPTNKTLSISPDVEHPEFRGITFDELCDAYTEQIGTLLTAGVDGILLETIFDTLNCKAAIKAYGIASERTGIRVPLMLSVTINDRQGRLLSGQTLEAFLISVEHADILSVGINCSFGAKDMIDNVRLLKEKAPYYISCHPNAGLPNAMGEYEETPERFAEDMRVMLDGNLVNIVGGCCGTTPEHIRALCNIKGEGRRAERCVPVQNTDRCKVSLSGLEPVPAADFYKIGERCNVAGSRKFLRLISEGAYDEALAIARKQVEAGAKVIDINMDDGLLDAEFQMRTFLNLIGSEPDICRVPVMIDSSDWRVISTALKCVQGKSIVNSISLKEGEEVFLAHAREIRSMGAATVVMLFDEKGQATDYERRIEIAGRAYRLLTEKAGMPARDIIFDPNVLSVATGMAEHDAYAWDFLRAVEWIHVNLPDVHISGGISNLSFSFRGNNYIREAMHAVFIHEGCKRGMDFAIVNPSPKVRYEDIPAEHLEVIEEVMLRPSSQASEALIGLAQRLFEEQEARKAAANAQGDNPTPAAKNEPALSVEERLYRALMNGVSDTLERDLHEALEKYPHAVDIIEGPLMAGMNKVGTLFGEGRMFLPQVVKTARTMKNAVAILQPYIEAEKTDRTKSAGRVLLATVKGDVHDIGKNIVGVVMACNGYEIIDLGVMVSPEDIVRAAIEQKPDIIGLSGLITPSLEYMIQTLRQLNEAGVRIPVMIGGATTSAVHTALKMSPVYEGPVIWVKDASQNAPIAHEFTSADTQETAIRKLREEQQALSKSVKPQPVEPFSEAQRKKPRFF